jgi:hypothetical protein
MPVIWYSVYMHCMYAYACFSRTIARTMASSSAQKAPTLQSLAVRYITTTVHTYTLMHIHTCAQLAQAVLKSHTHWPGLLSSGTLTEVQRVGQHLHTLQQQQHQQRAAELSEKVAAAAAAAAEAQAAAEARALARRKMAVPRLISMRSRASSVIPGSSRSLQSQ